MFSLAVQARCCIATGVGLVVLAATFATCLFSPARGYSVSKFLAFETMEWARDIEGDFKLFIANGYFFFGCGSFPVVGTDVVA